MAWDSPRAGCIAECFEQAKDLADAGQRLAQLFGRSGPVSNDGPVAVNGDFTAIDSGFAPYDGASAHLNSMPVNTRLVGTEGPGGGDNGEDGSVVFINNVAAGGLPHVDLHGDGGFAINIPNGVFWNQGETWVLKWAQVQSVGSLEDEKSYSAPAGDRTYYYANCFTCSDSKGRGLTRIPVRVFAQVEFPNSAVGTYISYIRDIHGVAWTLISSSQESVNYAKATGDWDWVAGYNDKVGYALFQDADDVFAATAGASETTYTVYLPATAGSDPNIHIGDLVTYEVDASGNKVADSGYLDSKINSIELWGGTTSNVKAGWVEYTAMRGRFPVGYDPGDGDYDTLEETGGSHPIQPTEHSSGAATWSIDDHEFTTSTNATGIEVSSSPTGVTVGDHAAKDVSSSATGIEVSSSATGVTVGDHPAKDTSSSRTGMDEHTIPTTQGFDAVAGGTDVTNLDDSDFGLGEFIEGDIGLGLVTLEHTGDAHTHSISLYTHDVTDPEHTHSIGDSGHTHSIGLYSHSVTDPEHTHSIGDAGHEHTAKLAHTGTLPHASEDYRPPYSTQLYIIRVGPDDD